MSRNLAAGVSVLLVLTAPAFSQTGKYNETLAIGSATPAWKDLPGVDGKKHSLADLQDKDVVVVVFTCNSCPVAEDYEERILGFRKKYGPESKVALVAINVNTIPEDALPKMIERATERKFNFPYLYDETQKIAKLYGAAYTPEFFVLDKDRKVAYMGAMDKATSGEARVNYVDRAVEATLKGKKPDVTETLPRGCKIRFVRKKNTQ